MSDSDIDSALEQEGRGWRATLPPDPNYRRPSEARNRGARRVTAALALAAVIPLVALIVVLRSAAPTASAVTARDLSALIPRPGDDVIAQGSVLAVPGQPVRICAPYTIQDADRPFECTNRAVTVVGLDLNALPDRREVNGVVYTLHAEVRGKWDGAQIVASGVSSEPSFERLPVPCPAPAGGWPSTPSDPLQTENLVRALQAEIDAHPDLYIAATSGVADGVDVEIVTTVDKPASAMARLQPFSALGLCVVQGVRVDTGQLDQVAASLQRPEWTVEEDRTTGTVRVWLTMLSDESVAILNGYPAVIPVPLVAKAP